ncbi:MAG TPA: beta-ketoacyl synthase N-terminal-like domain-containing protein [Verrucomicrobiota bacterium]|nr:beta-ketoacyl synthase N-terminal-like domain-containing protein [Verrucomicrobiota bacterium]HNT15092.1 beta-ketoacyl synthase N-terminal-like domain-containing protein [Verrucomicrobiota bacterium]
MSRIFITAAHAATPADIATARLGNRFGRMDLASQLALLAVEPMAAQLGNFAADRIGLVIGAVAGSLSTDAAYWSGHATAGGLSPTLFIYTLPSSIIGELSIRHKITGPGLCSVGANAPLLDESAALLRSGEADAVICANIQVISTPLAALLQQPEAAVAHALLLERHGPGLREWHQNDRDIKQVFATLRAQI